MDAGFIDLTEPHLRDFKPEAQALTVLLAEDLLKVIYDITIDFWVTFGLLDLEDGLRDGRRCE